MSFNESSHANVYWFNPSWIVNIYLFSFLLVLNIHNYELTLLAFKIKAIFNVCNINCTVYKHGYDIYQNII